MMINSKSVLTLLCFLLLSACTILTEMDEGLDALVGKDYHDAIEVLGFPTAARKNGDRTVYTWLNKTVGVVNTPQTALNRGGELDNKFYQGVSTTNFHHTQPYKCKVQLSVDSKDIIVKHNAVGQLSACRDYIQRLDQYLDRQI